MACLGGTWEDPRPWVRFDGGVPVSGEPILGRICDKAHMPWASTRRRQCHGCPAYRGKDWTGQIVGALAPDGETIMSLKLAEYEQYVHWVEEEMEPERFYAWLDEGTRGITDEARAEYMRQWRADHPGYDKRKRKRDRAAYMRNYRAAKRNPETVMLPRGLGQSNGGSEVPAPARTREQGDYGVTIEEIQKRAGIEAKPSKSIKHEVAQ